MKLPKAEYRCLACGHQWQQEPARGPCPVCQHDYVKWENYEEVRQYWDERKRRPAKKPAQLVA